MLLLERDTFPRFKIGESLMPGTYETFERLGVLDKLKETAFRVGHMGDHTVAELDAVLDALGEVLT